MKVISGYMIYGNSLLKVNTDPCLFADPVDLDLKSALITEMLNIVGFHIPEASGERTLI